jgi:hypothetical protein
MLILFSIGGALRDSRDRSLPAPPRVIPLEEIAFQGPQVNPAVVVRNPRYPNIYEVSFTLRFNNYPAEENARTIMYRIYEEAERTTRRAGHAQGEFTVTLESIHARSGQLRHVPLGYLRIIIGQDTWPQWWRRFRDFMGTENDMFLTTSAQEVSPFAVRYILSFNNETFGRPQVAGANTKFNGKKSLPLELVSFEGIANPSFYVPQHMVSTRQDCFVRCLVFGLGKYITRLNDHPRYHGRRLGPSPAYTPKYYSTHPYMMRNVVDSLCDIYGWDCVEMLDFKEASEQFLQDPMWKDIRIVVFNVYRRLLGMFHGSEPNNNSHKVVSMVFHDNHLYAVTSVSYFLAVRSSVYCKGCFKMNVSHMDDPDEPCATWWENVDFILNASNPSVFRKRKISDASSEKLKAVICRDCRKPIGTEVVGRMIEHAYCTIHPPNAAKSLNRIHGSEHLFPETYVDELEEDELEEYLMTETKVEKEPKKVAVWVWDSESMLVPTTLRELRNEGEDEYLPNAMLNQTVYEHRVNFVHVKKLFAPDDHPGYSFDTMEQFLVWMQDLSKPNFQDTRDLIDADEKISSHIFVAHNFKGYDGRLLYDTMRKNFSYYMQPEAVFQGSKILQLKLKNAKLTFIDSLCHIAKSLRQMPSVFGLTGLVGKGEFPYLFNIPQNQDYVGPLPAFQYYDPENVSAERYDELAEWHRVESVKVGNTWNFKDELKKYCVQDVHVLKKCMEAYYEFGVTLTGLNPLRSMTIASYALTVFLNNDLPPNTLYLLSKEQMDFARQALRGGRTDVRQRYRKYSDEEVAAGRYACYFDVQSLYPSVQFDKPMPVGKPTVYKFNTPARLDIEYDCPTWLYNLLTNPPDNINDFFCGIIHCDIEVTGYLHHPVLVNVEHPSGETQNVKQAEKKLLASLYNKENYYVTSVELWYALRTGCYRVTKVYELHKYEASTDLFKSYISRWLKLKIEASGWKDQMPWDEFEDYHRDNLGINLKREDMVKNVGKKEVAKLLLNSLWGKLGQSVKQKLQHFNANSSDAKKMKLQVDHGFAKYVTSKPIPLADEQGVVLEETYETNDWRMLSQTSSIPVACFVSAWGRIRLWEELNKLGERVLYHDTDSIIFERDPDGYNIEQGYYLGQWEDECGGCPIVEFVGVAPKTYAYVKKKRDGTLDYSNLRCKGFTLNYRTAQIIDFHTMKDLVTNKRDFAKIKENRFVWDQQRMFMYTYDMEKVLSGVYGKGIITEDHKILPFGGQRFKPDLYK